MARACTVTAACQRAVHAESCRHSPDFWNPNCSAMSARLHRRGAQRRGTFRTGRRGTLFWTRSRYAADSDPLLRVLSDGQFLGRRAFPEQGQCACHRRPHQDLEVRVREGLFRETCSSSNVIGCACRRCANGAEDSAAGAAFHERARANSAWCQGVSKPRSRPWSICRGAHRGQLENAALLTGCAGQVVEAAFCRPI